MAFVENGVLYVVGGLDRSGAATSSVTEVALPGDLWMAGPWSHTRWPMRRSHPQVPRIS